MWHLDIRNNKVTQLPCASLQDIQVRDPSILTAGYSLLARPRRLNTLLQENYLGRAKKKCISCQMHGVVRRDRFDRQVVNGSNHNGLIRFPSLKEASPIFDAMYLTMPPAKRISVIVHGVKEPEWSRNASRADPGYWKYLIDLNIPEGIKFGHLRNAMLSKDIGDHVFKQVHFPNGKREPDVSAIEYEELKDENFIHPSDKESEAIEKKGFVTCWMCGLRRDLP